MLLGILRFEWRYHTRQYTFAAATAALALVALTLVGTGYGPAGVNVNSPYTVMQSLGLVSLLGVFVLTIFCANAALRDVEHGMTELVFSRPVGKPRYLLGRFAGALLAATTAMTIAALVLMLAPLVMDVEPGRLGPVQPLAYAWAMLVLVLPNLLLAGALLFAVAVLTRSTLATYVGGVAIYALYLVCALMVDSPLMAGAAPPTPEGLARAALLDPFGLSAFFEQTRYWTAAERNVRYLSLSGHLLVNRTLWMAVAIAVLGLVYHRFTFHLSPGRRKARSRPITSDVAADAIPSTPYRPVAQAAEGVRGWLPAFAAAARMELRHVLRGWTFLAMLALWAFVAGMEAVAQLGGGEYGTRVLPTTGLMLNSVSLPLLLLGTIAVVYYGAEVAWRERVVGFDPLADATPASTAIFYLAKAAALAALPMLMALVAVVVGVAVQLANGQPHLQPGLYLTLLWFGGVPLALFAVGVLAIQALSPNRWIGMILGLALAVVVRQGPAMGLEHPMLRFGAGPSVEHSDMDGFGPFAAPFAAFMLYWSAAAALLACVTWGVWRRGLDAGVGARLAALPRRWGPAGRRAAFASTVVLGVTGGALLWQTNVAHAWEGSGAREAWRAGYERSYRRLEGRPQPSIVAVRTSVDLFPSNRRAAIEGVYTIENRTREPVDTVWVMMGRDGADAHVSMPGGRLAVDDRRFGMYGFRLDRPLAPGARAELRFGLTLDRGGIRAGGFEEDVAANGTLMMSAQTFPALGYRSGYELSDPQARRRHGLASAPTALPGLDRVDSVRAAAADAWLTLDATVSTSGDQTAIAPGELAGTWTRGGRRYFRYVTERPVTPLFGFVSARYAVRRVRHGAVEVEVWYHPAHSANVGRILAAATRSLDVLGARYGAYPHPTLRIAEVPAWSSFGGFALPGLVLFTEDRGFLSDPRGGGVDLVTRRVAHEVAHQWWGHTLSPAGMAGATTLTETLAKHSEQLVVAAMHGPRALAPMLAFDEDRYLAGRAQEPRTERTLMEAEDEPYLYYGKGAVVMNGLRDLLGEAAVDRAIRRVLAAHGGPTGGATTPDLLGALLAEARTAEARALVSEWLTDRVVYDLRVDSATATPLGNGRSRVAARITARKSARRGATDVPGRMDGEAIDVAVFEGDPSTGRVLYAGKQRVVGGQITLAVDVSAPAAYVVVDPFIRRIDRDRSDNARRVVAAP
jgi:ABC-2 type transport system permease protein